MGCDIHAYLEVEHTSKPHSKQDIPPIRSFGRISIDRDYVLFAIMAGVHSIEIVPVVPPRGAPDKYGRIADNDAYLRVTDNPKYADLEGWALNTQAEKWVNQELSQFVCHGKYITHPDWHTHSYLYIDEIKEVLKQYVRLETPYQTTQTTVDTLNGIIGAMEGFNANSANRARLTFWFDN